MNIFVIATTLQAGGGITIYKQFLSHLPEYVGQNRYWIFVNPVLPQVEIEGVTYISFPLQSKVRRILFEGKLLQAEVSKLRVKPDVVVSLQNNGYKCFKDCKQIVYYHQSLPLYPGRYNLFKSTERTLFNYKYIFPHIVKRTWTKDTQFVVQTPVVKRRFVSYFGVPSANVHVCFPDIEKIDVTLCKAYDWGDNRYHLMFVGDDSKYRNGCTLVKAMGLLKKKKSQLAENITIHVNSSPEKAPIMYNEVLKNSVSDNFVFEGIIRHDNLLDFYKSATALVFPSSVETVGLPLLEAAALGLSVIVANADYAYEVMKDYDGVKFADVSDYEVWGKSIIEVCESNKRYKPLSQTRKSDWGYFFDLIK